MKHHVSCVFSIFLQPVSEYSSFYVLDVSQHVVSRDEACFLHCRVLEVVEIGRHKHARPLFHLIDVQHSHSCSGSVILCYLALGVPEIGRHSHDHLFVQPVDVFCHLWIDDVSQPDLSHDGLCILQFLVLKVVEIGKHGHDRVVSLEHDGQGMILDLLVVLDLVVVVRVGPPECCWLFLNLVFIIFHLNSTCGSSCNTSGRRAARSRPVPRYQFVGRCTTGQVHHAWKKKKKPVGDGLGQITPTKCLAFRSKNLQPNLHKLFFFFFPFFVLYCFRHSAVIVHEVVLCFPSFHPSLRIRWDHLPIFFWVSLPVFGL